MTSSTPSTHRASHRGAQGELPSAARDSSRLGVLLLIATEAALFACLAASAFYLRSRAPAWPPNGVELPELLLPLLNTALLLSSSVTMAWGEGGARRGARGRLALGLGLTLLLGAAFLGVQAFEYGRAEFAPADHAYASLFFTLTGLHGLHVFVGVIAIAVVLLWAQLGYFGARRHLALHNVALYWHFVDAVWLLVILPTVYLSPYLGG